MKLILFVAKYQIFPFSSVKQFVDPHSTPARTTHCPYRCCTIVQQCRAAVSAPPVCQTDDFLLEYFESGGGQNGSEENNPDIDEDFITVRDQEPWFNTNFSLYSRELVKFC